MVQLLWSVRTIIYSFIHVLYVHVEMCYLTKNCIKCISFPFFLIYLKGVYFYEQFVIPLYPYSPWQNIHNVILMSVTLYWLLYALFDALCTYINNFWIPWKATLTTWQGQNCLPLEPNKSHKKQCRFMSWCAQVKGKKNKAKQEMLTVIQKMTVMYN